MLSVELESDGKRYRVTDLSSMGSDYWRLPVVLRILLENVLRKELATLWTLENIGDIRQAGLVAGVELVRNWRTRESFDLRERAGIRVCEAMARRGVLTRPIGNVVVLIPPYCTTPIQMRKMVSALRDSVAEVFGNEMPTTSKRQALRKNRPAKAR